MAPVPQEILSECGPDVKQISHLRLLKLTKCVTMSKWVRKKHRAIIFENCAVIAASAIFVFTKHFTTNEPTIGIGDAR
jgi:hypothetical protein